MNKLQALNSFWNDFGLTAYDETAVPDTATLPYITYQTVIDSFDKTVSSTASLWYYGSTLTDISIKTLQIDYALNRNGVIVNYDNGAMWVRKGEPFAQRMSDSNDMIKRVILNVIIEFID